MKNGSSAQSSAANQARGAGVSRRSIQKPSSTPATWASTGGSLKKVRAVGKSSPPSRPQPSSASRSTSPPAPSHMVVTPGWVEIAVAAQSPAVIASSQACERCIQKFASSSVR